MTTDATNWLLYFAMLALGIAGLGLNLLGLFGLWLLVAAYAAYAWMTGWNHFVGWPSLGAVLGLAVFAEIVEFIGGAAGSKAAGGRMRGCLGGALGAIVGGIVITFLIPIPIVGTIIGACAGAFVGASIAEFSDKDWQHAMRVGWGSAKGRFFGIVSKGVIGIVMLLITALAGLPY